MSDRVRELLRQRALLQEHLAWLEHEIAAASDKKSEIAVAPAAPVAPPSPTALPPAATAGVAIAAKVIGATATSETAPAADRMLEEYRVPPTTLQSDVRRGCFLYFAAALMLVALGVTVLYFTIGTR